MTSAVKAPVSVNSSATQRSKSVAGALVSEIDTRRLRNVVLEQDPKRLIVRLAVPCLETGERLADVGQWLVFFWFGRCKAREHRRCHRRETREHCRARLAVARPAEFRPHDRKGIGDRDLLAVRGGGGVGECPHEIEPAIGEGALVLEILDALGDFAAERSFGHIRLCRGFLQLIEKRSGRRNHRALLEDGGREWESNPPRTDSRPFPDLKSGRPTGGASPPEFDAVAGGIPIAGWRNKSSRCLLRRRKSPRRMVTPWRSKNSRI